MSRAITQCRSGYCLRLMALLIAITPAITTQAQTTFDNVTATHLNPIRGDIFRSETWGVTIGDMEGDHWPDVFVTNHRNRPVYYKNAGDGSLVDHTLQVDLSRVWLNTRYTDRHGAAFSDIDGDGDHDLWGLQSSGITTHSPVFIVDSDGRVTDEGNVRGLPDMWGTYSQWLDFNLDGHSDVNRNGYQFFPTDINGDFGSPTSISTACSGDWASVADLNGDGSPDYACFAEGTFPKTIFSDFGTFQSDIGPSFPVVSNIVDGVIADLDNDLNGDFVFARGASQPNQALLIDDLRLEAALDANSPNDEETGFEFTGGGVLSITIHTNKSNLKVYVGDSGSVFTIDKKGTISLDPANGDYHGMTTNRSSERLYIGFDVATNTWEVIQHSSNNWWFIYVEIDASAPMSNLVSDTSTGLTERDLPIRPRVLMHESGGYVNRTFESNLATEIECRSVVAADFDNDMDVDLFFACSQGVANIANRYFDNLGDGSFTEMTNHGAEGAVGAGLASLAGNGESVGTADFNNDGFMDLFVTNGMNTQPLRTAGGPHELIMNNGGNGNHWISLELVGTNASAPDAIGARVIATAGSQQQLREQGGGYHRWSQNHDRIHFGLGPNTSVDLAITWPDGAVENFTGVGADAVYVVTQGSGISAAVLDPPAPFPPAVVGDECGAPEYWGDLDQAVFVYKDCATGVWSLRAVAGGAPTVLSYSGSVSSNDNIANVVDHSLESGDSVTQTNSNTVDFQLNAIANGEDGFDFELAPGADACLSLETSVAMPLLLGAQHIAVEPPVDLTSLTSCAPPVVGEFSVLPNTANEADGTVIVTVTLSAPNPNPVSVKFSTRNESAANGTDFWGTFQILDFAANEVSKTVTISLIDDTAPEADEFFTARLFGAVGAPIAVSEAAITIVDDDNGQTAKFSVLAKTVNEGDGVIDVEVVLSDPLNNPASVQFATRNESASNGNDFWGTFMILDFAAGETSKTVPITLIDDATVESDEFFTARLFNANGAPIDISEAAITIVDDDSAVTPVFSVNPVTVSESAGTVAVLVSVSPAPSAPASVQFSTRNESAVNGDDFWGTYQILDFAPGESSKLVTITLINDAVTEASEFFTARLFGASGGNIGVNEAPVTIEDDD